jgi:hypothetical protein
MMADEISAFLVWAHGTPVEPGLVRLVHFETSGVKYVDLLVYSVVGGVPVWRAVARLKDSQIDDLVIALVQDVSGVGELALGEAIVKRLE